MVLCFPSKKKKALLRKQIQEEAEAVQRRQAEDERIEIEKRAESERQHALRRQASQERRFKEQQKLDQLALELRAEKREQEDAQKELAEKLEAMEAEKKKQEEMLKELQEREANLAEELNRVKEQALEDAAKAADAQKADVLKKAEEQAKHIIDSAKEIVTTLDSDRDTEEQLRLAQLQQVADAERIRAQEAMAKLSSTEQELQQLRTLLQEAQQALEVSQSDVAAGPPRRSSAAGASAAPSADASLGEQAPNRRYGPSGLGVVSRVAIEFEDWTYRIASNCSACVRSFKTGKVDGYIEGPPKGLTCYQCGCTLPHHENHLCSICRFADLSDTPLFV